MKDDLIWLVLKYAEKHTLPDAPAIPKACHFEGWDLKVVHEHIKLCEEAGWLEVVDLGTMAGPEYAIRRLTYEGHRKLRSQRSCP